MKSFWTIVILAYLLIADFAYARCNGPTNKCLSAATAQSAAATPEEVARLRERLKEAGINEILRNCRPGKDTQITEFFGTMCGEGVVANRICNYSTNLECTYNETSFEMNASGVCMGSLHDCGTFDSCARDQEINKRDGSFRLPSDSVPKNGQGRAAGGVQ